MTAAALKRRRMRVQKARAVGYHAAREATWRTRFKHAKARDAQGVTTFGAGGTYNDAVSTRGYDDYWPGTSSADLDTLPDRDDLVAKSRGLFRNNPFARAIGHTLKREIVGRGIWPRPARSARELGWKTKRIRSYTRNVLQIWQRWAPTAYVRGGSIYQAQKLVQLALARDGECFVQIVGLDPMPHRPYRLAIDVIEAHRVSTPTDRKLNRNKNIRDGVELNSVGMPVAIWVEMEDLLESAYFNQRIRTRSGRSRWRRIPLFDDATGLANIVHVRDPERPSTRNVPLLSGALDQVHVLGEFIEAELHAKKAEGCIAAAITSQAGPGMDGSGSGDLELEPGLVARLLPGESISFLDPKRPGGSFGPFVEFMLRSIAFSSGLPYEVAFIAFAGMNYSNARTTLLHAQRFFEDGQDTLIEQFLRPVFCRLLWEAWQLGDLKVANFPKLAPELCSVGFMGQGFKWVDPEKEAKANVLLLENNLTSRSMALTPQGVDFEDVVSDLIYEQEVMKELGLNVAQKPKPEPPTDGDDGEETEEGSEELQEAA